MDGELVFADHVEARQMGEHTRELRFPEPIALHSMKIIRRGEKLPGTNFEGRTYPDVRMIGLEVYAADVMASGSTMITVESTSLGSYSGDSLITNCIVVRGKFIKLSIAIYGQLLPETSLPEAPIAQHLRPVAPFEDKLDMADVEEKLVLDDRSIDDEAMAFGRALGLGAVQEANMRLGEHAVWVAEAAQSAEILEADAVARLESMAQDMVTLAQRAPENAAHVHLGPDLARALLALVQRCRERLEFRALRAALNALATSLVSATAAAELLSKGLDLILAILQEGKDKKGSATSCLTNCLHVLLQLCSHVVGMEVLLGLSESASSPTPYEVVLSLVLDGIGDRSEQVALALLRRAGFYEALSRFDSCCSKLETETNKGDALQRLAAHALQDVAILLDQLSQPARDVQHACFLLGDELISGHLGDSRLPAVISGLSGSAQDPLVQNLHGFLESFLTGRRFLSNICIFLRRLPLMAPEDRLLSFRPFQRVMCSLLSCSGGPQFLADSLALTSMLNLLEGEAGRKLPAIRFPAALLRDLSAPQMAALVGLHVKVLRLSLQLVASTRSKGRGGLLAEEHAFPVLAALHGLCVQGSAGRCAVVYAFRSIFFTEWLLRQIEGRLDEKGNSSQLQPSFRHLVAILHALVLSDPAGAAAEKFGGRILGLVQKGIRVLEPQGESAQTANLLEFALDNEGAEGLGKAIRSGRRSADLECLKNLKEISAQLRPWEDPGAAQLPHVKLMSSLMLTKGARSLKRSEEERGNRRMSLVLGGHAGASNGVEIPEVDFKASESLEQEADDHERYPSDDLNELPLVAIRVLCRRAAAGPREALAIALEDGAGKARDGLAQLLPWLIRCAGALSLNLEASILREDKKPIASIYATRRAHLQLLEAALPMCAHLLGALRDAGLSHFRHTELCQTLLLLAQRLTAGLAGLAPRVTNDPEFRLLWRHCMVWLCRLFRLWFQAFPDVAGGQLLLPLLRHARVLPANFAGGLMLLATCGTLKPVLPASAYNFSVEFTNVAQTGTDGLQSHVVLLPTGTRTGSYAVVSLRSGSEEAGEKLGQFCKSDIDWEANLGDSSDALVRALTRERELAAPALGLVESVNSRRERLCLDDVGELLALVMESAVTSDAFLHLCTARVMEKLTVAGLPVLQCIRRLAEAALNGVMEENEDISGGAARDPRDGRAVSRLLLLLNHFGMLSTAARLALTEHSIETLCQSVLAHTPASSLPPMAFSQSLRLLGLMFATPSSHSVPKCRMVAKAVNLLINSSASINATTVCAALELLHSLCSPQWLCLNMLFTPENSEDLVTVSTSSAFRLEKCVEHLVSELRAQEDTEDWLRATALMLSLQLQVLSHCPNRTTFTELVFARSLEDLKLALQAVQGDVSQILQKIEALNKGLDMKVGGPVPTSLPLQSFAPPARKKENDSVEAKKGGEDTWAGDDSTNAVAEVVSLLDAAADLECDAEWSTVVELDSTDSDDTKIEWEFDAAVLRKKRQDFLEKFESDRKAKRLKQQDKSLEKRDEKGMVKQPDPPREKEIAGRAVATKSKDGVNPAEALQGFLKDHPEFMRVLQNPKKCLADPRVKTMFVTELQNYPAVKSFLASKGLQLS